MSVTILRANALALPLADSSVDLVVTSPPYWSLRAYQDNGETYDGQIGAEATPGEFVDNLIECTREWMRVLKPSGFFRFATDIEDYADWTLAHVLREPRLVFAPEAAGSWHVPYPGWQPTRYEQKARREGRSRSFYFEFRRAG